MGGLNLADLADQYLRERLARRELAPSTAPQYRYILGAFVRDIGDQELDLRSLERWQEGRRRLALSSHRAHYNVVRSFCTWLTRRGHLAVNPMLELVKPRPPKAVPRALPPNNVAELLGVVDRSRDRAMAWLMVGCGLRCAEVARLETADWDQRGGTLFVRGKRGDERVLPVPTTVSVALRAYLDERPVGSWGPMFRSLRSPTEGLTPKTVSRLMGEWMRMADVKRAARDGVGAHSLRHTAASDVLDKCGDLRVVQALLGHSNIATTSIYLRRASLANMREAMEGREYRP